jgi:ORF6N domain
MASSRSAGLAPVEHIGRSILLLRGQRVILDADLAALYGVPTKALNQAVKRKDSGNHVLSACGLRRYAASDRSTYL